MYTLAEIAQRLEGKVQGDAAKVIQGVGSLEHATVDELAYFGDRRYINLLRATKAGAVLVNAEAAADCPTNAVIVDNPQLRFASIAQSFDRREPVPVGIHPTAVIASDVELGESVRIGAYVVISSGVKIDDGVEIGPHTSLGAYSQVGTDSSIRDNVVIYHDVVIGERCTIHSNTVIGADGFGIAPESDGKLKEIPQVGSVRLGSDVLVGASSTIDRGTLDDTVIDDGVKIDDQVHIAHNCKVGAHSILCGRVSLAGSVTLGKHCVLAGDVGVAGEGPVYVTSGVQIGAKTFVSRDITEPGRYSGGTLHMKNSSWRRNALRFNELDELVKRVVRLERKIDNASD